MLQCIRIYLYNLEWYSNNITGNGNSQLYIQLYAIGHFIEEMCSECVQNPGAELVLSVKENIGNEPASVIWELFWYGSNCA